MLGLVDYESEEDKQQNGNEKKEESAKPMNLGFFFF